VLVHCAWIFHFLAPCFVSFLLCCSLMCPHVITLHLSHQHFIPCTKTPRTRKEKENVLPPVFRPSNTRIRVLLKYEPLASTSTCCSVFWERPHPWALLYLQLRPKSEVQANNERKTQPAPCMLCNPGPLFPSNSSPIINQGKNRS
jgi:hypothetical protein